MYSMDSVNLVVVPPGAALPEKRVVSQLHEGEKTKVADGAMQFNMKVAPAVCNTNMQKSSHSFDGHGPAKVAFVVFGEWCWCPARSPATPGESA